MNAYLTYLKWKEFEATKSNFLPAKPIEKVVDKIKQSEVYTVLKKLPKGGNMHLHQSKKDRHKVCHYIFRNKEAVDIFFHPNCFRFHSLSIIFFN